MKQFWTGLMLGVAITATAMAMGCQGSQRIAERWDRPAHPTEYKTAYLGFTKHQFAAVMAMQGILAGKLAETTFQNAKDINAARTMIAELAWRMADALEATEE